MRVITGKARGINLKTPDGMATRPTSDRVKESLFSIIQFEIQGSHVLDLFGGTGQLGIEALSRGAECCVFVDQSKEACRLIEENLQRTKLRNKAKVICCDYMQYLKNTHEQFEIILLDPPYAEVFLENSLKMITEIDILQSGGIIVTERPVGKKLSLDFPGYNRSKDYRYSSTLLTFFRKDSES